MPCGRITAAGIVLVLREQPGALRPAAVGPCWLPSGVGQNGLGRQNGRNPGRLRGQAGVAVRLGTMGMQASGRGTELTGERGRWMVCIIGTCNGLS